MGSVSSELRENLGVIHRQDSSKLDGIHRTLEAARIVAGIIARTIGAAEVDARSKLLNAEGVPRTKAWARAFRTTWGLRIAAGACRAASGKFTAADVELNLRFIVPARDAARKRRRRRGRSAKFDVKGGVKR
jgi:hypothetical protein